MLKFADAPRIDLLVRSGHGLNVDPNSLDTSQIASYVGSGQNMQFMDFIMYMVPDTLLGFLANGEPMADEIQRINGSET